MLSIQQKEELSQVHGLKLSDLLRGLLTRKGFYVSEKEDKQPFIDLNRQFIETDDYTEPDISRLFPKARQLMRAVKTFAPKVKQGFSFHADNESSFFEKDRDSGKETFRQAGSYVYDTAKYYPNSPKSDPLTESYVSDLIKTWQETMDEHKLPLLNGIDDIDDKELGMNRFVDGYAAVPSNEKNIDGVVMPRTKEIHDLTFETSMVRWSDQINRWWCFETSGWVKEDRRAEMVEIFLSKIVVPMIRFQRQTERQS